MTESGHTFRLEAVVSGGELGAERAALDFAITKTIRHFGFCGLGRPSEDGRIPLRYAIVETESEGPAEAIFLNVSASDATVLFDPIPNGYSRRMPLVVEACHRTRRPVLTLQGCFDPKADAHRLASFLASLRPASLHVTGPSESEAPGIHEHVSKVLGLVAIAASPFEKAVISPHPEKGSVPPLPLPNHPDLQEGYGHLS